MLTGYNPTAIFNAVLVLGVGIVVVRVFSIVSALIQCLSESKSKK